MSLLEIGYGAMVGLAPLIIVLMFAKGRILNGIKLKLNPHAKLVEFIDNEGYSREIITSKNKIRVKHGSKLNEATLGKPYQYDRNTKRSKFYVVEGQPTNIDPLAGKPPIEQAEYVSYVVEEAYNAGKMEAGFLGKRDRLLTIFALLIAANMAVSGISIVIFMMGINNFGAALGNVDGKLNEIRDEFRTVADSLVVPGVEVIPGDLNGGG